MDETQVIRTVERYLPRLKSAMHLNSWNIRVEIMSMPNPATITLAELPGYKTAVLNLDPTRAESEEDVLSSLFHELCHLLHAEFETFRLAAREHVQGEQALKALDVVYDNACEHLVARMECLLECGLGMTPKQLGDRAVKLKKKLEAERGY